MKTRLEDLWGRLASFLRRRWPVLLFALGAGLRIGLYLEDRCLWADEARVALNILHLSPRELLGPLQFDQVAPPGFLLLVKAVELAFGGSELSLRLVPLVCGVGSLLLFARIARRWLKPAAAPLACLLFALGEPLLYYSTEVKQYSLDVVVTLVLWLLAGRAEEEPLRLGRWVTLGLSGAAALLFSHSAVFVLGGIAVAILFGAGPKQARPAPVVLALVGCLWLAVFAVVYELFLRRVAGNAQLVRYFTEIAPGLPPAGILPKVRWIVGRPLALLEFPGGLDRGGVPALCAIVGAVALFRSNRLLFLTWVTPGAVVLMAALARSYPFEGRLILFVVPALYLLVAAGAEEVRLRTQPGVLVAAVLVALLVFHPLGASIDELEHPRYFEQLEPVLEHVSASRRAGDAVYLYYGSQHAARYYLETRRLALADVPVEDLMAPPIVMRGRDWYAPALVSRPPSFFVGKSSRENWRDYGSQLDALAGIPRVWVVFSHVNV